MYIKVRVTAGVKEERIVQTNADHFKIFVREKAERNIANRRVLELIAVHYKIPVGKVRIVSGHHSPSKILNIDIEKTG